MIAAATTPKEISFIHALRASACLMVVYCHLVGGKVDYLKLDFLPHEAVKTVLIKPFLIAQNFGFLGVALFFIISGFIMAHSAKEGRWEFAVKRLLRIYPPFIAIVLLMLTFDLLTTYQPSEFSGLSLSQLALHLMLVPLEKGGLSVSWTLTVEMIFYGVCFAFLPLLRNNTLIFVAVLIGFTFVALQAAGVMSDITGDYRFRLNAGFITFMPTFAIGVLCYDFWAGRRSWAASLPIIISALAAQSVAISLFNPRLLEPTNNYALQIAIATVIFCAVLGFSGVWRSSLAERKLAAISYSIYLIHLPVGGRIIDWMIPFSGYTLALVAGLSASLGLSIAFWSAIEKPSQRLARYILTELPPSTLQTASPKARG